MTVWCVNCVLSFYVGKCVFPKKKKTVQSVIMKNIFLFIVSLFFVKLGVVSDEGGSGGGSESLDDLFGEEDPEGEEGKGEESPEGEEDPEENGEEGDPEGNGEEGTEGEEGKGGDPSEASKKIEGLTSELKASQAEINKLKENGIIARATDDCPFPEIQTIDAVEKEREFLVSLKHWLTENPDGGNCPLLKDGKELNADDVKKHLGNVSRELDIYLPRQQRFIEKLEASNAEALKAHPSLADASSKLSAKVLEFAEKNPAIKSLTNWKIIAADVVIGKAFRERAANRPQKKTKEKSKEQKKPSSVAQRKSSGGSNKEPAASFDATDPVESVSASLEKDLEEYFD